MSLPGRLFDKLTLKFSAAFLQLAEERNLHPHRLLLLQAQKESADYASLHMKEAVILKGQAEVLGFSLKQITQAGSVLEFGVAAGDSIRLIAASVNQPVHGFDSFEGLPENWGGRHEGKGHYSTGGRLPGVPANVMLHKGWFEDTLAGYLSSTSEPVAFLHIDCDLYSSTKTVLEALSSRIVAGTVIVFDEYFNFISWKEHEYKAFRQFVAAHNVRYDYICWGYQQVAIVITEIDANDDA